MYFFFHFGMEEKVKRILYEGITGLKETYGSMLWSMRVTEREKVNVFEVKLMSMLDVIVRNRIEIEVVY